MMSEKETVQREEERKEESIGRLRQRLLITDRTTTKRFQ